MAQLADFKGLHYGEAMVVSGLGHSVSSFRDPERFRIIGVNDIGRAFQPSYLFVMDSPASFGPERFRFIRESGAEYIFTDHDLGLREDNIVRFPIRHSDTPQLDDPNALYFIGRPPTSPFLALCLAAHMGAKAIGVIGVDFTDHHFFAADGTHKLRPGLLGINLRFYVLANALLDRGVKIFNLSVESKISAFPRLTADEFYFLQSSGRSRAWSRPLQRLSLVSNSPVNERVAALAKLINTETNVSCRLIAPNSRDIKTRATPEVEDLVLGGPGSAFECATLPLSSIPHDGEDFSLAWSSALCPMFFDELTEASTSTQGDANPISLNGHKKRLPITVIVSQANATGSELAQTVHSLWPDLSQQDELVIVARSGQNDFPLWLRNSSQIGFIEQEPGESPVAVRNRAASLASAPIFLFTDANTQAPERWAKSMACAFRDPRIAAVGPALSNMYQPHAKGYGMRWTDAELNTTWLPRVKDSLHAVPLLSGVFLAVRRSAFNQAGGFDSGMPQGGAEDLELCLRLWTLGWKCVVNPEVEVLSVDPYTEGALRPSEYWEDLLHNLLRLATMHFSQERVEAFIALRANDPVFPRVCARLLRGDASQRSLQTACLRKKWEAWFFE